MSKQEDLLEQVHTKELAETLVELVANNNASNGTDFRDMISSFMSLDAKHNMAWATYGYKDTLTFHDFFVMYRRFGIAKAGIDRPVDKCWQTAPFLVEDLKTHAPTAWEKTITNIFESIYFWQRLKGLDSRQRVGRYGGLLIIVRDGRPLSAPIDAGVLSPESLVKLTPLYEEQLYITEYDSDPMSIRYGQPITYQYKEYLQGENTRTKERTVTLHYSRVIPWAEGSDTDNITSGVPALESCFNDLITMEKVIGAGGEGFWKNARASLNLNYNDQLDINKLATVLGASNTDEIPTKMNDIIKKFVTGFDQSLMTQGADIKPLSVQLPDPKEFFDVALNSCAASLDIPSTILIGQQTGRLASDEDKTAWAQSMEARRDLFLKPMIRKTVDYLMMLGLLPIPESGMYFIQWDSLLEPSEKQRIEKAKLMSEINRNSLATGEPVPFTSEQIAITAGFEQDETEDDGETDDDYLDDNSEE